MTYREQHLEFFHLTEADGLSHNVAISLFQDQLGFIWISTFSGLNRFDGYDFKVFRHDPDNPNSLSDDMIRAMTFDQKRRLIWLATKAGGLNKFDPLAETFTHYRGHLENEGRSDKTFPTSTSAVYVDCMGCVWVGGNSELIEFDPQTETFVRYRHDPTNPNSIGPGLVHAICEDQAGQLWIGIRSGGGLNRFDRESRSFIHYPTNPLNLHGPGSKSVHIVYVDRAGVLWVGTEDQGLSYLEPNSQTFVRLQHDPKAQSSLSHNYVRDVLEDRAGNLWVATLDGLNKLNREHQTFNHYRYNPTDPTTLSQNGLSRLFEDQMGGLWVSTDTGLNYCYSEQQQFTSYRRDFLNPNSLDDSVVKFIYEAQKDILWLGTYQGLNKFDRTQNRFKHFQHDPLNPNSLGRNVFISAILADNKGKFWVGLWGGELNFFDPKSERFWPASQDPDLPTSQVINNVLTLHKDNNHHIWVGSYHQGLYQFDDAGRYLAHYKHDPNDPTSLSGHSLHYIYEDQHGSLWIGTEDSGLDRFDSVTKSFIHYRYQPQQPGCISSDRVLCMLEDKAGTLWIGTGNGLNRFDRRTETFTHYGPKNGMPAITVYGILEHEDTGHLWLGTVQGLVRFNPDAEQSRLFDLTDASQNTFSQNACYQNARGEMFFGGVNGLTVFHPDDITLNLNAPPVVITNFLIFNKSAPIGGDSPLQQAIWATDQITLAEEDYNFTFEFSALSYVAPKNNRYRYKLEGFDPDWHEVDSRRRYAAYSNLPAGEYLFRVIGSNNHGVWNEEGASIKIKVAQPPWEKLRLEKEAAEAASQAKSNFLSSMSHELRTPLNAILGYAQILKRNTGKDSTFNNGLKTIYDSGLHLLNLINDVLDIARIEPGKIELFAEPVDLATFLQSIRNLMLPEAQTKKLRFVYDVPDRLPQTVLIDSKRLRQVLLNLLGNAIKFTETGTITFTVECQPVAIQQETEVYSQMTVRFAIADTGSGIPAQYQTTIFQPFEQARNRQEGQPGVGLGLTISQELVALMGGHIQLESKPDVGSTFSFAVNMPVVEQLVNDEPAAAEQIIGYHGTRRHLLIADDNLDNQIILENILQSLGFQVTLVEDGLALVEQALAIRPDLILTDLIMPAKPGIEAIQAIRQQPETERIPIIAMSASVFATHLEQSLRAGANAFIPKPVDLEKLLSLLAQQLNLTWQYKDGVIIDAVDVDSGMEQVEIPPVEVLERLLESANFGDMDQIQAEAMALVNRNRQFAPFAQMLVDLAKRFEDRRIMELIEQQLGVEK